MAALTPRQQHAINAQTSSIEVGDKVYRRFESHELGPKIKDQWIHGKVVASKMHKGRGTKNGTCWWTLNFDHPAKRPLMCKEDEVVLMKVAAENYRRQKTGLLCKSEESENCQIFARGQK